MEFPWHVFPLHPESSVSGNGTIRTIVSASSDRTVKITCMNTALTLATLDHQKGPVLALDQHPTMPHILLTAGMDGQHHLVNVMTGKSVQSWSDHQKYIVRASFSQHADSHSAAGDWIVTASYDHTVRIYRRRNDAQGTQGSDDTQDELLSYCPVKTLYFRGAVEAMCITVHNQSNTLVIGTRQDTHLHYITLTDDFPHVRSSLNHNGDDWVSFTPMCISPSPSGNHVVVTTDSVSGLVLLCRVPTPPPSSTTTTSATSPSSFSFSDIVRRIYLPNGASPGEYERIECMWSIRNRDRILVSSTANQSLFEYVVSGTGKRQSGSMAVLADTENCGYWKSETYSFSFAHGSLSAAGIQDGETVGVRSFHMCSSEPILLLGASTGAIRAYSSKD
jgi:WD40 repeat protein